MIKVLSSYEGLSGSALEVFVGFRIGGKVETSQDFYVESRKKRSWLILNFFPRSFFSCSSYSIIIRNVLDFYVESRKKELANIELPPPFLSFNILLSFNSEHLRFLCRIKEQRRWLILNFHLPFLFIHILFMLILIPFVWLSGKYGDTQKRIQHSDPR